MAVNPYSFKDQHSEQWKQMQRQLGNKLTGNSQYAPPAVPKPVSPPVPLYKPPAPQPLYYPPAAQLPVSQLPYGAAGPVANQGGGSLTKRQAHVSKEVARREFEEYLAGFMAIALWVAIGFVGINALSAPSTIRWLMPDWLWVIMFGGAAAYSLYLVLCGPLRFVVRIARWLVSACMVMGFLYLIYAFVAGAYPFVR